jgi:hypothetical protein
MRRQVSTLVPVAAYAAHFFYNIFTPRLHVGLHAFASSTLIFVKLMTLGAALQIIIFTNSFIFVIMFF